VEHEHRLAEVGVVLLRDVGTELRVQAVRSLDGVGSGGENAVDQRVRVGLAVGVEEGLCRGGRGVRQQEKSKQ
jgi:hypothetical protein